MDEFGYPRAPVRQKLTITLDDLAGDDASNPTPRYAQPPQSVPPQTMTPVTAVQASAVAVPYVPVAGVPEPPVTFHQTANAVNARPRAGFWQRFWALFLDGLLLAIPMGILYFVFLFIFGVFGLLLVPFISMGYFAFFEGGPRGQTPGKAALGIRVVSRSHGGPVGRGPAFGRQLGRILSAFFLDLGYLWMLWDRDRQTWHDKFVDTIVVPTSAYPLP